MDQQTQYSTVKMLWGAQGRIGQGLGQSGIVDGVPAHSRAWNRMGFNVPFKPFCISVVQWCIFKWPENSDILPWIWSCSVLAESVPDWTEWAHPAHLMHPLTSPVSWSSVLSGLTLCMCRSQFSFNLPFQPSFPSLWIWSKRSTSFLCKT